MINKNFSRSTAILSATILLSLLVSNTFCQQQLLQESTKKKILQTVEYKYLVFTTHCFDTFFTHNNFFHFDCLKITAAKLMGYGLIMGGAIIKFPQIFKILSLKSVTGISFVSVVFEVSTSILTSAYCVYKGNPFSLYGENVFIGIQMLLIIGLFVAFGKGSKLVYTSFLFIMIFVAYYVSDPHHLPELIIQNSIIVQTVLMCASRLTQIFQVYSIKSTGSLALATWALSLLGNVARVITIGVQASHDTKYMMSMVCVMVLNAIVVFQFYLYRNNKVPVSVGNEKIKNKKQ